MSNPSSSLTLLRSTRAALPLVCLLGLASCGQEAPRFAGPTPHVWSKDVVRVLSEVPVQDAGRVKPLSTYARFELLKMNSSTSFTLIDGENRRRLSAMDWLLDVLLFPEVARHYRCFEVDDDQTLAAVGLHLDGRRKRDRYSYDELEPFAAALAERASAYSQIAAKERTPVQHHTLRLSSGLRDFSALIRFFDYARAPYPADSEETRALFGGRTEVSFGDVIAKLDDVIDGARAAKLSGAIQSGFDPVIRELESRLLRTQLLTLLPPADSSEREEWLSPFYACLERASQRFQTGAGDAALVDEVHRDVLTGLGQLATLARVEDGRAQVADAESFVTIARGVRDDLRSLAEQRGEYGRIPTEVSFYRGKFFWFNPWFFLVGFLLVALGYAVPPAQRRLSQVAAAIVTASAVLLTIGIVYRCVIRGRPPVSTLYETILFVTAVGVIVCLITEWILPRRIALGVAAMMGAVGMFLANRYELHELTDTMPQLVAVLDTNFWLATHVTSITVGYSAGLFAAAVAHVYLLLHTLRGPKQKDLRALSRMIYGLLCFGLLFSTVGTILGGVWANDSWGRFWGWDPKENGALMIVLSQLMIVHARLGGFVRDFGVAVSTVLAGFIVVFSWWGVNLLGVGLHSYGFTSGAALALKWFYGLETAFLAVVLLSWFTSRGNPTATTA